MTNTDRQFEEWFRQYAKSPIDPWHREFARSVWQAASEEPDALLDGLIESLKRFNKPGGIIECDRKLKHALVPIDELQIICRAAAKASKYRGGCDVRTYHSQMQ